MRLMHKSRVVSLAFEAFNLQADDTGVWIGGTVVSLVAVDHGEPQVSAGDFVHGKNDGNVPSSFHFCKRVHQIILLHGKREVVVFQRVATSDGSIIIELHCRKYPIDRVDRKSTRLNSSH